MYGNILEFLYTPKFDSHRAYLAETYLIHVYHRDVAEFAFDGTTQAGTKRSSAVDLSKLGMIWKVNFRNTLTSHCLEVRTCF